MPKPSHGVSSQSFLGSNTHTHYTFPVPLGPKTQADNSLPSNKEVLETLKAIDELNPHMKKLMPFVQNTKVQRK